MGRRISKPTYFDDAKDKDLLEWLKTKGNYAGFVRLLVTDLYNKEHDKPTLIFQSQSINLNPFIQELIQLQKNSCCITNDGED